MWKSFIIIILWHGSSDIMVWQLGVGFNQKRRTTVALQWPLVATLWVASNMPKHASRFVLFNRPFYPKWLTQEWLRSIKAHNQYRHDYKCSTIRLTKSNQIWRCIGSCRVWCFCLYFFSSVLESAVSKKHNTKIYNLHQDTTKKQQGT